LNECLRRHLRRPGGSWRLDETYAQVKGVWAYLYRAIDSTGDTIDFLLSPKRDAVAAKLFLQLALRNRAQIRPRVITVDGHQAYAHAITELKHSGELGKRCTCRRSPYLNNLVEQDHRFINKRIAASLGFRSVEGAFNTIEGYEAMHMIRKGRFVGWRRGMCSASAPSFTLCSASLLNQPQTKLKSFIRSHLFATMSSPPVAFEIDC